MSEHVAKDTVDATDKARNYVLNELGIDQSKFETGPVYIDIREMLIRVPIIFLRKISVQVVGNGIPVKSYEVARRL